MGISPEQIEDRIKDIQSKIDPESIFYGKLLNWWNRNWHYGIGLSDRWIFDTGQSMHPFECRNVGIRFVLNIDHISFPPDQTIHRLIHAIRRFGWWNYGLLGWNCEHFARLVATDEPVCYEILNQPWPISYFIRGNFRHPHAKQDFRVYLAEVDPPTPNLGLWNYVPRYFRAMSKTFLRLSKMTLRTGSSYGYPNKKLIAQIIK